MFHNLLQREAVIHDDVQRYEPEHRVKFLPILRLTRKVLAQKKSYVLRFAEHTVKIFPPIPPYALYGLRCLPSRLWPKCNRPLRLGNP
jgi:hypothetical protein